jgi:membrane protein required for colicin V production
VNWLDIVLGAILLFSVARGFARGLTRSLIGFIASILAIFLSFGFYRIVGAWFHGWGLSRSTANVAGFIAVFIAVLLFGGLVAALVAKLLKIVGLGFLDRLGGAVLGLVRGVVLGIVIIMLMIAFSPNPPPDSVRESRFAPYLVQASTLLSHFAPRELRDAYDVGKEKLQKAWEEFTDEVKKMKVEKN